MNVLPSAIAQHVIPASAADGVILGQHSTLGISIASGVHERAPRPVPHEPAERRVGQPGCFEHRRIDVDERDRSLADGTGPDAGPRHNERHRGRLLVHRELPEEPARAGRLTMVRRVDNERVLREVELPQRVQDPTDLPIQVRHRAVVGSNQLSNLLLAKGPVKVEEPSEVLHHRMARPLFLPPLRRQRDVVDRVAVVELRRGDVRRVRKHESDLEHPRRSIVRVIVQPRARAISIVVIVAEVGRVAGPRLLYSAALVPAGSIVANAAQNVTYAIDHVQRLDLVPKAVIAALPLEVELPDRVDEATVLAQLVMPAAYPTVVRNAVVPVSDFVP